MQKKKSVSKAPAVEYGFVSMNRYGDHHVGQGFSTVAEAKQGIEDVATEETNSVIVFQVIQTGFYTKQFKWDKPNG
jgi:hypothetical protein